MLLKLEEDLKPNTNFNGYIALFSAFDWRNTIDYKIETHNRKIQYVFFNHNFVLNIGYVNCCPNTLKYTLLVQFRS